ncbi:MAG: retropepsin-like aspartic protease [Pseudomonadota bacterium]
MRIKHSLLLALSGIALTSGAAKAESIPAPIVPVEDIIATAEDDALRMTVPVMINGQGPFRFVIDTGADRTVISSELAERLGLP